jgi:lysophospholipase L1-like esterase
MKLVEVSRQVLTTFLIPAFIFILLLELAGRLFDPAGISYYPEMARYLDTMIIEEPIGYRNRPGLQGNFFSVPVSINRFGLRDDDFPVQKAGNEFRILLLGDSVPFGIGVTRDNMLSRQLQDLLNAGRTSATDYRVLNMGVPSYNTEQELVQLKETGLSFKPDLVLLLYSLNDLEGKMWVYEKRAGLFADTMQRSYAGALMFVFYRELRNRLSGVIGTASASVPVEQLQQAFTGYQVDAGRWASSRDAMQEINRLLRERGIPFILLLNNGNRALTGLWSREARAGGFMVANLNTWTDPRWKNDKKSKYTNSYIDSHPNKDGNRILATMIYEFILGRGLVTAH